MEKVWGELPLCAELLESARPVFLWGAGQQGGHAAAHFSEHGLSLAAVIDNDPKKQSTLLHGMPVVSYASVAQQLEAGARVLVTGKYYPEIKAFLEQEGYTEGTDFCDWREFLGAYFWQTHRQVHSYRVDLSVTQKCTLACEKCNMFMPMFERPVHHDLDAMKRDVDAYFTVVDRVLVFDVLGGEPFLYPQLAELLAYIAGSYGGRIGELHLFTNGTLLPPEALVALCKQYGIIMDVSDYSAAVPAIGPRVRQFVQVMAREGIRCDVSVADEWGDFGYPDVHREDKAALMALFEACRPSFRGLYDGKVYYCHLQASAQQLGDVPGCPNDWVDLLAEEPLEQKKENFLRLDTGHPILGYLTFCARCNGCSPPNKCMVPAAVQVKTTARK